MNIFDSADLDKFLSTNLTQSTEDVQNPVWVGLPIQKGQQVH